MGDRRGGARLRSAAPDLLRGGSAAARAGPALRQRPLRPQPLRRDSLHRRRGLVLPPRRGSRLARRLLAGGALLRRPSADGPFPLGERAPPVLAAERPGPPVRGLDPSQQSRPLRDRDRLPAAALGAGVLEAGDAARDPQPETRQLLPEP